MTTNLVLTVIGDDKPGLVEALSRAIASNSGNWLESSMSQLAGKFAGILRVSVADTEAEKLIAALQNLSPDLKLLIERAAADGAGDSSLSVALNLVANDRPGIIREISRALAGLSINVENLSTRCVSAPMSGETLFKAEALLKVPAGFKLERLQLELEDLADDLIVEIQSA
ncbi:MAG TPA: glycine cleavage system protein R [Gammaproteobacteria bacterium]|jgi:glycine cleavage system regulatory protein|nr:glycine cleavage system protein R [Gammaproteobacteria bacterium]HIN89497.1 glycine cleavage system protein R [Porticoccaceae bacterium]